MNQPPPYNPYAPPQAAPPFPGAPAPGGQPQPWTTSDVMGLSWSRFKDHWLVLVLASFIVMVCGVLPGQGVGLLQRLGAIETSSVTAILLSVASILLAQVIGAFFQVGITRVWLQAARGETPELGTLFTGGDRFLPMLGLTILMSLIIVTGFALFIVPGVILGLGLFFSQYYVVDAEMGPIEAMKASWAVTKGQKGELLLLGFAGLGIVLLGLVMCCVGVIATAPIFWVATAIAFTRASGREFVRVGGLEGAAALPPP